MKILIVSTFAHPHIGGLELIVAQQAKTLAETGHDVIVFTSRHEDGLAAEEMINGYRVIRTKVWNKVETRTQVPYPIWGPRSVLRLAALVRWSDLVHIHDVYYQPTFLAAFLAHGLRRPLFVTQHVSIVEHSSPLVMGVERLVYSTAGALVWSWSGGIVVYNVMVERFLAARGVPAEKVFLSYNGIDLDLYRPGSNSIREVVRARYGLPASQPIVLFVGRLVPKKGYRELMAAHDAAYETVLAGPGPVPADVPAGVTFLGSVNGNDLIELYQASDLFAFPAVGEMLTLSMQEAMACGLPVVTTADSAYDGYLLDADGIALVSAAPEVLRRTFLEILSDRNRWLRMSTYSRRLAHERFDWRRNAAGLTDIYRLAGIDDHGRTDDGSGPPVAVRAQR
jgi:D-inositol-3-phosphate glycosyltransferase